jgi:hypothetical protein
MPSNSSQEFLIYVSPAVVAVLYAIARWVESRARITSEVERSISREVELQSEEEPLRPDNSGSEPDAPARKKSSTKATTYTSPGNKRKRDRSTKKRN